MWLVCSRQTHQHVAGLVCTSLNTAGVPRRHSVTVCRHAVIILWLWSLPLPNEELGRPTEPFQNAFQGEALFSSVWVLDLGYERLKSASKRHSERFVRPSQIVFWRAYSFENANEIASCYHHVTHVCSIHTNMSQVWHARPLTRLAWTSFNNEHVWTIMRYNCVSLTPYGNAVSILWVRRPRLHAGHRDSEVYPSQTKILAVRTNISEDFAFPNLRLGSIKLQRFGKVGRTFQNACSKHFQGCEYRIWATNRWKGLFKRSGRANFNALGKVGSAFPNLCSPNEDFGRMNKRYNAGFRSSFQRFVAQIEYSRPWHVLRKSASYLLFILPKSSFGEHKIFVWEVRPLVKSARNQTVGGWMSRPQMI
jgi:hypothetical protein